MSDEWQQDPDDPQQWHLAGVPWYRATPHRTITGHVANTRYVTNMGTSQRCACGAMQHGDTWYRPHMVTDPMHDRRDMCWCGTDHRMEGQ